MDRVNCNVHFELVDLSLLNIDQSIIFQGTEDRGHTFSYVWKLLEIMQPKLIELFQLTSIESHNGNSRVLCLKGRSYPLLHQALQRIAQALSGPVYVNKVPLDLVVALRVLLHQKRQFSLNTGCWMHFNWKEREVACYGLEPMLAESFIQKVYADVNSCRNNPVNGWVIVDHAFPIKLKRFIKKYVDFVESRSGARVAVKKEGKGNGNVVVQFYGPYNSIQQACDVITKELGPMCDGIMKQRNKKKAVTSPLSPNTNTPIRTPFASPFDKINNMNVNTTSNPTTPTTPYATVSQVPQAPSNKSQLEEFFPPPPLPIGPKDYPCNEKRLSDSSIGIASYSLFTCSEYSDSSRSTSTDFHPISGSSSMISGSPSMISGSSSSISITPTTISASPSIHSDDDPLGISVVCEDMGNESSNRWLRDLLEYAHAKNDVLVRKGRQ